MSINCSGDSSTVGLPHKYFSLQDSGLLLPGCKAGEVRMWRGEGSLNHESPLSSRNWTNKKNTIPTLLSFILLCPEWQWPHSISFPLTAWKIVPVHLWISSGSTCDPDTCQAFDLNPIMHSNWSLTGLHRAQNHYIESIIKTSQINKCVSLSCFKINRLCLKHLASVT